jgi:hypothetical protein
LRHGKDDEEDELRLEEVKVTGRAGQAGQGLREAGSARDERVRIEIEISPDRRRRIGGVRSKVRELSNERSEARE